MKYGVYCRRSGNIRCFYAQGRTDEIVAYAVCAPRGGQGEKPSLFDYTEAHTFSNTGQKEKYWIK